MQSINSQIKLIIKDVDKSRAEAIFTTPDLEDILIGITGTNQIWKSYGNRTPKEDTIFSLIKNTPEGETYLRNKYISGDILPDNPTYTTDSVLLKKAGDWHTLQGIYKSAFGHSIRKKDHLDELSNENKHKLLDAILTAQGTNMLAELSGSALNFSRTHQSKNNEKYLSYEKIMETVKNFSATKTDNGTIYLETISLDEVYPIAFSTGNNAESIIVLNKEEDFIFTKANEFGFNNTHENNESDALDALRKFGFKEYEFISQRQEEDENKSYSRVKYFDFSLKIDNALRPKKVLAASIDISNKSRLKETAKTLGIKGYTKLGDDELLEAIGSKCLEDQTVEKILGKPGSFIRRTSTSLHNPFRKDNDKPTTPRDQDQEALITAYITSIEARGNNSDLRFMHKDIVPLPATRIPRERPGVYESDQEIEILEFPDFLK